VVGVTQPTRLTCRNRSVAGSNPARPTTKRECTQNLSRSNPSFLESFYDFGIGLHAASPTRRNHVVNSVFGSLLCDRLFQDSSHQNVGDAHVENPIDFCSLPCYFIIYYSLSFSFFGQCENLRVGRASYESILTKSCNKRASVIFEK